MDKSIKDELLETYLVGNNVDDKILIIVGHALNEEDVKRMSEEDIEKCISVAECAYNQALWDIIESAKKCMPKERKDG